MPGAESGDKFCVEPRGFNRRPGVWSVRTSITLARLDGGSSLKPLEKRLADLYSSHAGGVIRLAYLLTGDREAAEDVCQEAFARLGESWVHCEIPNALPAISSGRL